MGIGTDLLRMLEPAVRPAGLAGPTPKASVPIESRSFESVLDEAQSMAGGDEEGPLGVAKPEGGSEGGGGTPKSSASPLAALAQVDRIENPALRRMAAGEA